jgi:hypothetical protein
MLGKEQALEEVSLVSMIGMSLAVAIIAGLLKVLATFGSNLTLAAAVFGCPVCLAYAQPVCARLIEEANEKDGDFSLAKTIIQTSMIIPFCIFFAAPLIDEDGYCSHQRSVIMVESGPRTLDEAFKGKTNTNYLDKDDDEKCKRKGAWDYASRFENFLFVCAAVGSAFWLGVVTLFHWALAKDNRDIQVSTRRDSSPTTAKAPVTFRWDGASLLEASTQDRIAIAQEIVVAIKNSKTKTEKKKLLSSFEHWAPDQPVDDMSEDDKSQLVKAYEELITLIPAFYSPKEVHAGRHEIRIKKLGERLSTLGVQS